MKNSKSLTFSALRPGLTHLSAEGDFLLRSAMSRTNGTVNEHRRQKSRLAPRAPDQAELGLAKSGAVRKSRLVFFGSGPVAAKSLELLAPDFNIEAVITKPVPEHHRGSFPVLESAKKLGLKTFTATNKQQLSDLLVIKPVKSSLGLVIDYGIIISKDVIDYFPLGIINSHFSLLPQWRGADPITFAVLSGQKETGVSLMLINEKMDEGLLLAQEKLKIDEDMTTSELTNDLIELSNTMLSKHIPNYIEGKLRPYPQPNDKPTYSRRLVKEDGNLDLNKPAKRLEREVRAYDEWPKSKISLFGHNIIVTKAKMVISESDGSLAVKANPGFLEILELKAPSGRTMSGADFLRGYKKN